MQRVVWNVTSAKINTDSVCLSVKIIVPHRRSPFICTPGFEISAKVALPAENAKRQHAVAQMWFVLLGLGATPWPTRIAPRGVTLRPYKAASLRVQPQPKAFLAEDSGCAVQTSSDCKWVLLDGKCSPACRNIDCGFISCDCESIPSLERTPWRLLNVSYAAYAHRVRTPD